MVTTADSLTKAPGAMVKAISAFEKAVGGREALITAMLANPDLDDAQQLLIDQLADPSRANTPIGEICFASSMHIGHVLQLFKSGRFAHAQVLAVEKVAARLPEVAEDFVSRALPRRVDCSICTGTGYVQDPEGKAVACIPCRNSGKVIKDPTLEYQKLALDLGGLVHHNKSAGGVNIGIFPPGQSGGPVEARVLAEDLKNLRESSDKLLHPGRHSSQDRSEVLDSGTGEAIIDAEILPPVDEPPQPEVVVRAVASDSPLGPLAPPGQRPT